jgi:hypothetical protein
VHAALRAPLNMLLGPWGGFMASAEDSPFKYLPYVTLREGWSQLKVAFLAWAVLSVIVTAFVAATDFGISKTESYWSILPGPVWGVLGFAIVSWFLRGEELRFMFPRTFKGWFLLNFGVVLLVFAASVLPSWAFIPVYIGLLFFFGVLDELAAIGKRNYERLSGGT